MISLMTAVLLTIQIVLRWISGFYLDFQMQKQDTVYLGYTIQSRKSLRYIRGRYMDVQFTNLGSKDLGSFSEKHHLLKQKKKSKNFINAQKAEQ